jgi:hypothetical protein
MGVKTKRYQRILLRLFGILLAIIILEITLNVLGYIYSEKQESFNVDYENKTVILCIGESTTADLNTEEGSWPRELQKILDDEFPDEYKVINEGHIGVTTIYLLSKINEQIEKYNPHIVISMMGVNDNIRNKILFEDNNNKKYFSINELKTYKLFSLIYKRLRYKEIESKQSELYWSYFDTAFDYMNLAIEPDDFSKQNYYYSKYEEFLLKAYNVSTKNNPHIYSWLGELYCGPSERRDANKGISFLKKAIHINPFNEELYRRLANCYNDPITKIKLLEKSTSLMEDGFGRVEENINSLIELKKSLGYSESQIQIYLAQKLSFNGKYVDSNTRQVVSYHYNKLAQILAKNNITYIAMSYPTLDVNRTKSLFENHEGIFFIENKQNFENFLKNGSYDSLFIDYFGQFRNPVFKGNYGHTTNLGNKLIAQNVANTIINLTT